MQRLDRPSSTFVALLAAWLAGMAPLRADEAQTLTIVTWGGAYEASQKAAIFEPFTETTGIPLEVVRYDGGIQALRDHLAEGATPSWDVIDMVSAEASVACEEGLLERFDPALLAPAPDATPAADDFIKGAFGGCSVAQLLFATVIAYDDRAFPGEKPQDVADFFDLERFPGKRALRAAPDGLFDWALRAYGVPKSQIYDLLSTERGFDLAFRQLDRIRDELLWWQGGDEPVALLRDGEAAMVTGYNGRFFHAHAVNGLPISVIWDSALLEHASWAIMKGTAKKELAERFIRFATESEQLAAMANRISYGPARRSAMRRVGLHVETGVPMAPHMPTAPPHLAQALHKDQSWYAKTADLRHRRFEAWLNRHFQEGASTDEMAPSAGKDP
ncbi:MAG: ABC transporter substrate-binding protein [Geminicoccaceae bacterium]